MNRFVSFQLEMGVTYITNTGQPVTIIEILPDGDEVGVRADDLYYFGDNDIIYHVDGTCFESEHRIVDIA